MQQGAGEVAEDTGQAHNGPRSTTRRSAAYEALQRLKIRNRSLVLGCELSIVGELVDARSLQPFAEHLALLHRAEQPQEFGARVVVAASSTTVRHGWRRRGWLMLQHWCFGERGCRDAAYPRRGGGLRDPNGGHVECQQS
jgi:hypothetical protein